jgi:hypothetical protein
MVDRALDAPRLIDASPARSRSARSTSATPFDARVLNLQRLAGNRAVTAMVGAPAIQRAPTPTVTAGVNVDSEGNELGTGAGRPYLTRLAGLNFPHRGAPLPAALPLNPNATYQAVRAQAIAARDAQFQVANELRGDMKYWFAKVYYHVTKNVIVDADQGVYAYPIAVLQEAAAFHATYRHNIEEWRAGHIANVEHNWRAAFAEAESVNDGSWYRTRSQEILNALLPSMQAHIRFDLPRAIAAVYEREYAGAPGVSIGTFHADFDRMGPVFDRATAQIQAEIDAECSAIDPGDWHWAQDLGFPFLFHIALERGHAWEKAETITSGHARGIHDQGGMQKRLEAYQTGAHPMRGDDDFGISTSWGSGDLTEEVVHDYDWNGQPR